MPFTIEFSPDARDHLRVLKKREQQILLDAVVDQLTHQPDVPTKHRKPLDENPIAPWELRIGDFRVFYEVSRDDQMVVILVVGRKFHNQLIIGDEEIEL